MLKSNNNIGSRFAKLFAPQGIQGYVGNQYIDSMNMPSFNGNVPSFNTNNANNANPTNNGWSSFLHLNYSTKKIVWIICW